MEGQGEGIGGKGARRQAGERREGGRGPFVAGRGLGSSGVPYTVVAVERGRRVVDGTASFIGAALKLGRARRLLIRR